MFTDNRPRDRYVTKDFLEFQTVHTTAEYPCVVDQRNGIEYYHDGATSTDLNMHEPPPAGTEQLVRNRYRYFRLLYAQVANDFERCKSDSLQQVAFAKHGRGNVPSASAGAEAFLARCKVRMPAIKKELDALDEQVSKLPAETVQRQRAELEAKRLEALEQQHARLLNASL